MSQSDAQFIPGGGKLAAWRRGAVSVLAVLVVFSSYAVIHSAYRYRQLFSEQQQIMQSTDQLQVEWGQLLLEQSALAAHSQVEQQARKLDMYVPAPNEIVVIKQ